MPRQNQNNEARIDWMSHPDYLGHTEFVSDANGDAYQYFWYSPFGDAIIEEHANTASFSSRYLFNAKELDPETGRYYYGARYYDPGLSIWLSVDPLSHIDPNLTPYHFVRNNPIMLVDPTGMSAVCPDCPDNGKYVEQITSGEFYTYNSETGTTTRHPGEVLDEVEVTAQAGGSQLSKTFPLRHDSSCGSGF